MELGVVCCLEFLFCGSSYFYMKVRITFRIVEERDDFSYSVTWLLLHNLLPYS